ncbi:MAG TPA: LacI family DNA-binding transcriptional regulator [Trueperaceae bacterium]
MSIKDVAARAEVDPSTVSRALLNDPWIPRRTREAIREIATEMEYVPNAVARELVTGRSRSIGACLPEIGDSGPAEQLLSLDQAVREQGYRLLLRLTHGGRHREIECVEWFREHRVAGIIVFRSSWRRGAYQFAGTGLPPVVEVVPPRSDAARLTGRQLFDTLLERIAQTD